MHQTDEDMKFKRPEAPELESYDNYEGVLLIIASDYKYKTKYEEYLVAEAEWKDAYKLRAWKYSMDGIPVTMAIAAMCGPQISLRIGCQFKKIARTQPVQLWKF